MSSTSKKREPSYYWCQVDFRTNLVPCFFSGVSWSFGDSEIMKPRWIGEKIKVQEVKIE